MPRRLAHHRQARGRHLGLNGAKRWIGNATFADYVVIYARDLDGQQRQGVRR